MVKTNALRQLETAGITYELREFPYDEDNPCGLKSSDPDADLLEQMFKTLVTRSDRGNIVVFCLPVTEELDLKKCAAAAGEKRIEMVHMKEILGLTGYIRGGCSPVGMKKKYPAIFDETAQLYERIFVSAGQRGLQMCVNAQQLIDFTGGIVADVTRR